MERKFGSTKAVLIFGAACAIIAAGIGAYAMLRRVDAGFVNESCGALRWDPTSLPVPVYLDAAGADDEWSADLGSGVDSWGGLLEFRGLLPEGEAIADPVVIAEVRSGLEDHGTARLRWDRVCALQRVELQLPGALLHGATRERAVQHELGHALGLDHDDSETSVMYRTATSLFEWSVSDADRALLRLAYGRGP